MIDEKIPFINSVFHLTDFSEASEKAFDHALAIALLHKTKLTILHVEGRHLSKEEWSQLPLVKKVLERWKVLDHVASDAEVANDFGIDVTQIDLANKDPEKAILDYLELTPADLLIMATVHHSESVLQWLHPSLAEMLYRKTHIRTLFVPAESRPFVSHETGEVHLRRILVPVDTAPNPARVVDLAVLVAKAYKKEHDTDIALVHIGDTKYMPEMHHDVEASIVWDEIHRKGNAAHEIVAVAKELDVDLIMMATHGHNGVMDILRGSVTEHVLNESGCPVLAISVD